MKKLPESTILIIKSVIPLLVIVLLFVILGKLAFNKIVEIQGKISEAQRQKAILTQKLDLLRTVTSTGVQDANEVKNSLPDTNPTLAVVSQLKLLAQENGLILSSVKSSGRVDEGEELESVAISFNLLGGRAEINRFLLRLNTLAPITILNRAKVSESQGSYTGVITVNSYWSEFPKFLPASIEEYQEFTEEDKETLELVHSLVQPNFLDLPASQSTGKENPFSQ